MFLAARVARSPDDLMVFDEAIVGACRDALLFF
jgi:hypothetical protein